MGLIIAITIIGIIGYIIAIPIIVGILYLAININRYRGN